MPRLLLEKIECLHDRNYFHFSIHLYRLWNFLIFQKWNLGKRNNLELPRFLRCRRPTHLLSTWLRFNRWCLRPKLWFINKSHRWNWQLHQIRRLLSIIKSKAISPKQYYFSTDTQECSQIMCQGYFYISDSGKECLQDTCSKTNEEIDIDGKTCICS